ncbi:type I secretion membrane fusion protein, HlyD family [compost metagenome]
MNRKNHGRALALRFLPMALLLGIAAGGCSEHSANPSPVASVSNGELSEKREVAMARGKVEVQGGLLEVMSPQDGLVETLAVKEGDHVRRGQVLLKLASEQARMELELAQSELGVIQARRRAQAERLPAARRLASRMREAARAGALDPQRADESLQAQRDIESAVAILEAERATASKKVALAQFAVQRQTLNAAHDAIVLKLNVQSGSRVSAQAQRPLMVLLPQRALIVRAELNESYADSVKPGMRASIHVEAETQGGMRPEPLPARVLRLAATYGSSHLDDEAPGRTNLRVVDCILEIDQAAAVGLRLGRNVRVSFYE